MSNFGYGTTGEVLTSNGAGVMPSFQPGGGGGSSTAFSAYLSSPSGGLTGSGTFYLMQYDSTFRNDSGIFDVSTGLVTVNKTGLWLFSTNVEGLNFVVQNNIFILLFEKNGGQQFGTVLFNPSLIYAGISSALAIVTQYGIQMTSGDTMGVRFDVEGNATDNVTANGGVSAFTAFSGVFLG